MSVVRDNSPAGCSARRKSFRAAGIAAPALALSMVLAAPADADAGGWDLMYLDWGGGSRPMVVDPSEATQIDAVVMSTDVAGLLLGVDCFGQIRLANGEPFNGTSLALTAGFDDGATLALGNFNYAGGSYFAPFAPDAAAMFDRPGNVTISDPGVGFAATFSLQGFVAAHNQIACTD